MESIEARLSCLLDKDPYLIPFSKLIKRRLERVEETSRSLKRGETDNSLSLNHEYFGLHFQKEWVFREWAPNATAIYLIGSMNSWKVKKEFELERVREEGVWEINIPPSRLAHGDLYRLHVCWAEGEGDRIPAYTRRVVQDPNTLIFNAQVWAPPEPYHWQQTDFKRPDNPPLIYEAHVGMAQEEEKIGSYREFTLKILPRIVASGYNTLQLMAIQEHPYYGSFGYQVSSFFAPSSRFGTPEELKELIDTAHSQGIAVVMDIVHSHAVSNETEGLSRFDGTTFQYFHSGQRGTHEVWGSRCFNYGKYEVLGFLLSNCRYWLDEYKFDGFRFDGVTSMIYLHHGIGKKFTSYNDYFESVDEDALTYLALANKLIHEIRSDAITIAEDVSGMPGLALSQYKGGFGFDYRLAMGIPDYWIHLAKNVKDEDWSLGRLWFELTNRRKEEKTISYVESHDQALVGEQSLIFRLIGTEMYYNMRIHDENIRVSRGMALHKMIRLITLATAGQGYLNFIGNEYGHPEWIDFPREGNNWSFKYARRQWHLVDDKKLKYHLLARFDREMITLAKTHHILEQRNLQLLHDSFDNKVIIFRRGNLIFAFNFHPNNSYTDYKFEAPPGEYHMVLNCDAPEYGGYNRLAHGQRHYTLTDAEERSILSLYLPARSAFVLSSCTS